MKPFSSREKSLYYGLTNVHEFVAMTMEDKGFQKMLNKIPFKEDKTILQRIKDLINEYIAELAKEIGFDIKDNSALKSSIEDIIDLVHSEDVQPHITKDDNIDRYEGGLYRFHYNKDGMPVSYEYAPVGEGRDAMTIPKTASKRAKEMHRKVKKSLEDSKSASQSVAKIEEKETLGEFTTGDRVSHSKWGEGVITKLNPEADSVTVEFDNARTTTKGKKELRSMAISGLIKLGDVSQPLKPATESEVITQPTTETSIAKKSITFDDGIEIDTGDIVLNKDQREALLKMANFVKDGHQEGNKTFGLEGYAGTGKTTVINILSQYIRIIKPFKRVAFSSPTHRANSVMRQNGIKGVNTLHSLFGLEPQINLEEFDIREAKFQKGHIKLSRGEILIIDESSLINDSLYDLIIKASKELQTQVIFIGDSAQLSPVKQSKPSKSFSNVDKKAKLTIVERTGKNPLLAESMNIRNTEEGRTADKNNLCK